MSETLARKHQRQQALLRLVTQQRLSTQAELARALRSSGFSATQATVSRDIVELGLVKVARDGAHLYGPPPAATTGGGLERLRRFCEDYPVDSAVAGNVLVLKSPPGTANALAIALDTSGLADVVGTIAGDDTVFVAAKSPARARVLRSRLASYGIRGPRREIH